MKRKINLFFFFSFWVLCRLCKPTRGCFLTTQPIMAIICYIFCFPFALDRWVTSFSLYFFYYFFFLSFWGCNISFCAKVISVWLTSLTLCLKLKNFLNFFLVTRLWNVDTWRTTSRLCSLWQRQNIYIYLYIIILEMSINT